MKLVFKIPDDTILTAIRSIHELPKDSAEHQIAGELQKAVDELILLEKRLTAYQRNNPESGIKVKKR